MASSVIFEDLDSSTWWNDSLFYSYELDYVHYFSKKSSGRIEPNSKSWFVLKETTPYPKRSGLIVLSNTTVVDERGFELDWETLDVDFVNYT